MVIELGVLMSLHNLHRVGGLWWMHFLLRPIYVVLWFLVAIWFLQFDVLPLGSGQRFLIFPKMKLLCIHDGLWSFFLLVFLIGQYRKLGIFCSLSYRFWIFQALVFCLFDFPKGPPISLMIHKQQRCHIFWTFFLNHASSREQMVAPNSSMIFPVYSQALWCLEQGLKTKYAFPLYSRETGTKFCI